MSLKQLLGDRVWPGIVEDNIDPQRRGRVKIRVKYIFDNFDISVIPWAHPWKSPTGKNFEVPEKGKVVNVLFLNGDVYNPEYFTAEHYDINLQKHLEKMSDQEYNAFESVLFDGKTQIYRDLNKGLVLDHNKSNINLTEKGHINLNLRDNNSNVNIGSPDATQPALMTDHFLQWLDSHVKILSTTAYIGNMGAPLVPTPDLVQNIAEYNALRETFRSQRVWIVDNAEVLPQKRDAVVQTGDVFTDISKEGTIENINVLDQEQEVYEVVDREETGRTEFEVYDDVPKESLTGDINESASGENADDGVKPNGHVIKRPKPNTKYPPGQYPLNEMKVSNVLKKSGISAPGHYLLKEAADSLEALYALYEKSEFKGKQPIVFTSGYRTREMQDAIIRRNGMNSAWTAGCPPDSPLRQYIRPSGSASYNLGPHGTGTAVDINWGPNTSGTGELRKAVFRHPMYQWWYKHAAAFGWYNPAWARDPNGGFLEYWHWEYTGVINDPNRVPLAAEFRVPFDYDTDLAVLRRNGVKFDTRYV